MNDPGEFQHWMSSVKEFLKEEGAQQQRTRDPTTESTESTESGDSSACSFVGTPTSACCSIRSSEGTM
jgi:hypothetical protein